MASYKPGQSGNLKGRPIKELTFSHVVRSKLADEMTSEEYETAVQVIEYLADQVIQNAITLSKTDPKQFLEYMESIRDTTEGKPKQVQEIGGIDGGALEFIFRKED